MIQAILYDVLLRPDKFTRVKVLSNSTTGDIEETDVDFEWTCTGYGMNGNSTEHAAEFNLVYYGCDIPATNGLFDWYKSIYGNNNGDDDDKSQDDPYSAFYTTDAASIEHRKAPPPPLEKRRNMIIETVSKDAWFGERVKQTHLLVGAYHVEIGKHREENRDTEQLAVHFKAQFSR